MPIATYEDALKFWFSRVNYEQRGMPTDLRELKLDRMRSLLAMVGDPQERLRIVHIAGSKGKGSTAAMLAAVLQAAGYRTGLFTSPHLTRVEERIQVDSGPISPNELTSLFQELEPRILQLDEGGNAPTFFEVVTALGFMHFARRHTDVVVLEVGLGGRFDSTNVCMPLLAIITSISFDHVQQLGNTLAAIAAEKAGIIKPGRPVVSGVTSPEARSVIECTARERGSDLGQLGMDFGFSYQPAVWEPSTSKLGRVAVSTKERAWPSLEMALMGRHQAANAAVVVAAVARLRKEGLRIPEAAVARGLADVRWPARMEIVGTNPLVLLDCAHNVASVEALLSTLDESFPALRRSLVFAGSADKDLAGMLGLLARSFDVAFFTRYASSQRGAPPETLAEMWRSQSHHPCEVLKSPAAALAAAREWAGADGLICVTGSVFLAGELRAAFRG